MPGGGQIHRSGGDACALAARIRQGAPACTKEAVAWNPEFLREGFAVQDSLSPDPTAFGVISLGAGRDDPGQVYATPLADGVPALVMDLETAELVKVAANCLPGDRDLVHQRDGRGLLRRPRADVVDLARGAGLMTSGCRQAVPGALGFGLLVGGCLAQKDIRAFRATGQPAWASASVASLLAEVDAINMGRRAQTVQLDPARPSAAPLAGTLGSRYSGVAFKPGSDDVRDSPSLEVCDRLSSADRARWSAAARPRGDPERGAGHVRTSGTPGSVTGGRELAPTSFLMHLTEWADYRAIDPKWLATVVARPAIIDARCALDQTTWQSAGWTFRALGRPPRQLRPDPDEDH